MKCVVGVLFLKFEWYTFLFKSEAFISLKLLENVKEKGMISILPFETTITIE